MNTNHPALLAFLNDLRRVNIHYRLRQHRDDAIMVEVAVPGERWEVEFLRDGTVDVEVFKSDGQLFDAAALAPMLAKHRDPTPAAATATAIAKAAVVGASVRLA